MQNSDELYNSIFETLQRYKGETDILFWTFVVTQIGWIVYFIVKG